ncbi:MAG: hypothetical protein HC910_21785 [Spirulinaceae cyanobacterium SM2_1_0]|nr:hypothetical protein [Spirulinaceae cyanobacterium SM2_1_0]
MVGGSAETERDGRGELGRGRAGGSWRSLARWRSPARKLAIASALAIARLVRSS